jgi:hypothetical protein
MSYKLAVRVHVGQPPQPYTLIVDSATAITWIGGSKPYVKTSSSLATGKSMSIDMDDISLKGEQYVDSVHIGQESIIQSIGAGDSKGLPHNVDGILGIGPTALSNGVISSEPEILTVVDNLFVQKGVIEMIGIFLEDSHGHIDFGAIDPRFAEKIKYFPISTAYTAEFYWSFDGSISLGDQSILTGGPIAIHSASPVIRVADITFAKIQQLTGAVLDPSTQLLKLSPDQYYNMKSIIIKIGTTEFELTPNACILPRKDNTLFGGEPGGIYLAFTPTLPFGEGVDVVLGIPFLKRYYVAYDAMNNRIGNVCHVHLFYHCWVIYYKN